jgi:hypothetical protein
MPEKKAPNHPNLFFKKKEKTEGEIRSQLGGQWKVPMLSHPLKEKEKHLFASFYFPLTKFT